MAPRCSRSCARREFELAMFNIYDVRFWVRQAVWYAVQLVLLALLFRDTANTVVPLAYTSVALAMTVCEIPMIVVLWRDAMRRRQELQTAFDALDTQQIGVLTREQTLQIVRQFPKGTFKKLDRKTREVSLEVLLYAMEPTRVVVMFSLFEFACDFISLMATLMVFNGVAEPIIVFQGLLNVLDSWFLFHRFVNEYLAKYTTWNLCLRMILSIIYWSLMLGLLACLVSAYVIVLKVNELFPQPAENETQLHYGATVLEVDEFPGFVTGWILLFLLVGVFAYLCICYGVLAQCRLLKRQQRTAAGPHETVDGFFSVSSYLLIPPETFKLHKEKALQLVSDMSSAETSSRLQQHFRSAKHEEDKDKDHETDHQKKHLGGCCCCGGYRISGT